MDYIKKVIGEKVYLSLSIKEDLELYAKWLNDPKINYSFGKSHDAWTLERQEAYINDYNNSDDKFFFVIVSQETDEAVGIGLIYDISYVHGKGTMGILIDENQQSKGLNLNNMMLYAIEFNQKAIEMYKSIGFKEIGKRRKAYPINNNIYDEVYLDILKEEFNENR